MEKKENNILEVLKSWRLAKIKEILHSESYKNAIQELSAATKKKDNSWISIFVAIQWRFGVRPADLNKWAEYEKALLDNDINALKNFGTMVFPPVKLEKPNRNTELDAGGYLPFKVLPETPRYIIHHLIDKLLDHSIKNASPSFKSLKKINATRQRFRKEKITAFKVWELRKLRKSFKHIASELNLNEPAAKKSFYRAYEILFEKKYDPGFYEKPEIKKEYIKKECSTCPDNSDRGGSCSSLCPDVIEFVDQETASYLREKLL